LSNLHTSCKRRVVDKLIKCEPTGRQPRAREKRPEGGKDNDGTPPHEKVFFYPQDKKDKSLGGVSFVISDRRVREAVSFPGGRWIKSTSIKE